MPPYLGVFDCRGRPSVSHPIPCNFPISPTFQIFNLRSPPFQPPPFQLANSHTPLPPRWRMVVFPLDTTHLCHCVATTLHTAVLLCCPDVTQTTLALHCHVLTIPKDNAHFASFGWSSFSARSHSLSLSISYGPGPWSPRQPPHCNTDRTSEYYSTIGLPIVFPLYINVVPRYCSTVQHSPHATVLHYSYYCTTVLPHCGTIL